MGPLSAPQFPKISQVRVRSFGSFRLDDDRLRAALSCAGLGDPYLADFETRGKRSTMGFGIYTSRLLGASDV
jgi:hypothetical protein